MKILWFNWKDIRHPDAGGAEVVNHELARRLAADGHEVIFVVADFKASPVSRSPEHTDGYSVIRVGNRFTVYWHAYRYYLRYLKGWADLVIDEVNTIPFFAKFYVQEKNIIFAHQLAREIWFHEMPFPLSLVGYLIEPLYLRLLSNKTAITVSASSKRSLMRYGFREKNIRIISEGITIKPLEDLTEKSPAPSLLYFGSLRSMKRPDQVIKAFEIIKSKSVTLPVRRVTLSPSKGGTVYFDKLSMTNNLKLIIAGSASTSYGKKILQMIKESPYAKDIIYKGRVADEEKTTLMREATLLCVTSVKEGWGLVVTEANSQGTPAIVYNVDGLRDSVRDDDTGIVCKENTPANLAKNILHLLNNRDEYERLRHNAWNWSKKITFTKSHEDFKAIIFRQR